MDEDALFKVLKRQTKATLLELLYSAYYETNTQQRRHVFGDLMKESKSSRNLAQDIIRESEQTTETQAQENVLLKQLEATEAVVWSPYDAHGAAQTLSELLVAARQEGNANGKQHVLAL